MTPDALPVALSRLTDAVQDVKAAMEQSDDYDHLNACYFAAKAAAPILGRVADLALDKSSVMFERRPR